MEGDPATRRGGEPSRESLLASIAADDSCRCVYVMGACDSGKSYLAGEIVDRLETQGPLGYLDGDPGQGPCGPPGTVGLRLHRGGSVATSLSFVGAVSPAKALGETLSGIELLARLAGARGARRLVADSSGYLTGAMGLELQRRTVESLQPDLVIALRRGTKFPLALDDLPIPQGCRVVTLQASPHATRRTSAERRELRRGRFAKYFGPARRRRYLVASVRTDALPPGAEGRGLLLGLCDAGGLLLALAILERVEPGLESFIARAPEVAPSEVRSVRAGKLCLDDSYGESDLSPPDRISRRLTL